MKQKPLKYRFHNPNNVEDTADMLIKLAAELAVVRVDTAMCEVLLQSDEDALNVQSFETECA